MDVAACKAARAPSWIRKHGGGGRGGGGGGGTRYRQLSQHEEWDELLDVNTIPQHQAEIYNAS
jgi:hypothetical protein